MRFVPDGGYALSGLHGTVGPVSAAPPGNGFTDKPVTD
ncbi:hypothetical protein [Citrobacter pasteurii]|nr:hypothetical protein [Citrobacter pasteurii]